MKLALSPLGARPMKWDDTTLIYWLTTSLQWSTPRLPLVNFYVNPPRYTKPPQGGFFVPAIYASHQVVSVSPTHCLAHLVQSLPHHIAPSERSQLPSSVPPTKRAKFKPSEASYLAACRLRREKSYRFYNFVLFQNIGNLLFPLFEGSRNLLSLLGFFCILAIFFFENRFCTIIV